MRFVSRLFLLLPVLALATPALAFEAPKEAIEAFTGADRNGDIRLTATEFPAFIDAMAAHGQSTARTVHFLGAYDYAFSIADANRDGFVVPEELRAANEGYRSRQQASLSGKD